MASFNSAAFQASEANGQQQMGGGFLSRYLTKMLVNPTTVGFAAKALKTTAKTGAKAGKRAGKKVGKKAPKKKLYKGSATSVRKQNEILQKQIGYEKVPALTYVKPQTQIAKYKKFEVVPYNQQKAMKSISAASKPRFKTSGKARGPKKPKGPKKPGFFARNPKMKKVGKFALNTAALTGLSTAAEMGIAYALHKAAGGKTPSPAQVKEATMEAGVNIADKVLKGKGGTGVILSESRKAWEKQLKKTPRNGVNRLSPNALAKAERVLSSLQKFRARVKEHNKKNKEKLYRSKRHNSFGARQFGTGMGKRPPKKKKGGKKGGKKGKKGKKKGKKKSGGAKKGYAKMNVKRANARLKKMQDVFG